jgi:4-hydroxybenzoate polyprenyltransferase
VNITQVRSITKLHHHVKSHNLLCAARPHIRNTPRLIPSFVFQKHQQQWTSTTSTATPCQADKKQDRIVYNSWLDHLPAKIAPYAYLTRIDKPIGTWLLFWPCGKFFFFFFFFFLII